MAKNQDTKMHVVWGATGPFMAQLKRTDTDFVWEAAEPWKTKEIVLPASSHAEQLPVTKTANLIQCETDTVSQHVVLRRTDTNFVWEFSDLYKGKRAVSAVVPGPTFEQPEAHGSVVKQDSIAVVNTIRTLSVGKIGASFKKFMWEGRYTPEGRARAQLRKEKSQDHRFLCSLAFKHMRTQVWSIIRQASECSIQTSMYRLDHWANALKVHEKSFGNEYLYKYAVERMKKLQTYPAELQKTWFQVGKLRRILEEADMWQLKCFDIRFLEKMSGSSLPPMLDLVLASVMEKYSNLKNAVHEDANNETIVKIIVRRW
jgi:hypothetical protein